jgi:hypothetical protein
MSNNSLIFVITSPDHAVAEVPEVSFQKWFAFHWTICHGDGELMSNANVACHDKSDMSTDDLCSLKL